MTAYLQTILIFLLEIHKHCKLLSKKPSVICQWEVYKADTGSR